MFSSMYSCLSCVICKIVLFINVTGERQKLVNFCEVQILAATSLQFSHVQEIRDGSVRLCERAAKSSPIQKEIHVTVIVVIIVP